MEESSGNGKEKVGFWERISLLLRDCGFRNDSRTFWYLVEGVTLLIIMAVIFYDSLLAVPVLLPLLLPIVRRSRRRDEKKRRKEIVYEFKECMNSILTSLKAGTSAENAFRDAEREMVFLYGEKSAICAELKLIARGLDSNIPLEQLLQEFAQRSGADEIHDFADVFAIAKKSGGNMAEILGRTILQIQNRIDVEREIGVVISSSRMEQNIMDVVPFAIIAYIRISSEGFMDVLYGNAAGVMIMTLCMAVYLAAFLLSEKIVSIEV